MTLPRNKEPTKASSVRPKDRRFVLEALDEGRVSVIGTTKEMELGETERTSE